MVVENHYIIREVTLDASGVFVSSVERHILASGVDVQAWGGGNCLTQDHSKLLKLSGDDHTQYSLADGTRAFSGAVSGVTPTVGAHLATKTYIDAFSKIKTGTYTGDGETSQGITGIGFQPKYVEIAPRETSTGTAVRTYWTTDTIVDDIAAGAAVRQDENTSAIEDDRIISLDADGFTVDDNSADIDPNKNTKVYNYVALG